MKKVSFLLALIMATTTMFAANKGIPSEVLKAGKVKFNKATNTLVLEEGFKYSLGKGLVVFKTGKDLHILLKGNAEFKASLVFEDNVIIDSEGDYKLSVTSNISGSAIKCPSLPDHSIILMHRSHNRIPVGRCRIDRKPACPHDRHAGVLSSNGHTVHPVRNVPGLAPVNAQIRRLDGQSQGDAWIHRACILTQVPLCGRYGLRLGDTAA